MNIQNDIDQVEHALEQRLARDEAVLRSIGEGLVVADRDNNIVVMNKVAGQMLGWEVDMALGFPVGLVAPIITDSSGELNKEISVLNTESSANKGRYYLVRKDKTKFPAEITTSSVVVDQNVIGVVIVFRDITEHLEADRAKSDFIAIASHQLRTPLGSMKWNLEMLVNGDFGELSSEVKNVLSQVLESNKRMVALVNDLLNVSRIDQGRVYDKPEKTNIVPIIENAVTEILSLAKERNISVELAKTTDEIPQLVLDQKRFREVITNLLSNGVKYNHSGGRVDVRLGIKDRSVQIIISDTGIGISQKDQNRMFTKFFRGDNAIAVDTDGTGLGMYVVKSYVESWSGKITFSSEENKGTTFYIEIPIND